MIFSSQEFDGHEQVVSCFDKDAGLTAYIAVHSTALGPALGGCRIWHYASEAEAITDVLRLSKGMSYKNAVAGIPFGGGKCVVVSSQKDKSPEKMQALGRAVARLSGRYITGEDVGTTESDMIEIGKSTKFAMGLPKALGGSGDPSASTALGCFYGIQAALMHSTGGSDVAGKTVALQGLGNVGSNLACLLSKAGAKLVVADIDPTRAANCAGNLGAKIAPVARIHREEADVFAPCAMGAILNDTSIGELGAGIVAGAANNQLQHARHGQQLMDRGVLYAPDYVINAGGVIQLSSEISGASSDEVQSQVADIYQTLIDVFDRADRECTPTSEAADNLAQDRIEHGLRPARKAKEVTLC